MYSISFVIFNERRYKDPYASFILFFTILKRYLHFGTFYYKTLWFKLKGEYSYQVIDVVYELSTLLRFNNQCFSRYLKPLLS